MSNNHSFNIALLNKIFTNIIENGNGKCLRDNNPTDQRAENSLRPPMGLQYSEKTPHSEAGFSWSLNKKCTSCEDCFKQALQS